MVMIIQRAPSSSEEYHHQPSRKTVPLSLILYHYANLHPHWIHTRANIPTDQVAKLSSPPFFVLQLWSLEKATFGILLYSPSGYHGHSSSVRISFIDNSSVFIREEGLMMRALIKIDKNRSRHEDTAIVVVDMSPLGDWWGIGSMVHPANGVWFLRLTYSKLIAIGHQNLESSTKGPIRMGV